MRREETFLPDGTAPGTVLQINDEPCFYYSADSLKHSTPASSVVLAICFAFPILKRQFFFFLFFFFSSGLKEVGTEVIKEKKKIGKQGRVYYKVNSIKNASE